MPEIADVKMDLLPDKVQGLRWKLYQKARNEPKFRFFTLYDRICRKDVLEAAWRHVGKKGKAAGIDGVHTEDILSGEGGEDRFLTELREELLSKSYPPSPVKRVYIPKADGKKRPLGILEKRFVTSITMSEPPSPHPVDLVYPVRKIHLPSYSRGLKTRTPRETFLEIAST